MDKFQIANQQIGDHSDPNLSPNSIGAVTNEPLDLQVLFDSFEKQFNFQNCKSPYETLPHEILPPEFTVNSFQATVTVDKCNDSDSLCTFTDLSFNYILQNQSGTITTVTFEVEEFGKAVHFTPFNPYKSDEWREWKDNLWFNNDLMSLDSVYVKLHIEGSFWYKENGKVHHVDTFEHSDSLKVKVNRNT